MSERPTFFFSHARQDRQDSPFMSKFFSDLGKRVAAFTATQVPPHLGFIDSRVKQGEDWDSVIVKGLSQSRAFVAIYTPLFFQRAHCGKELGEFLLRSQKMRLDADGALKDVENVLPIRWYREDVYTINVGKTTILPRLLHRISDLPGLDAEEEDDIELKNAIDRYRRKGMARCVDAGPCYEELLDQFAKRIRDMSPLPPPVQPVSFATARDAFKYDWKQHFAASGGPVESSESTGAVVAAVPGTAIVEPLTTIVGYYVTGRSWTADDVQVDYADELIAESLDRPETTDAALATLLADFRAAGVEESFKVINAGSSPLNLESPDSLLSNLETLSKRSIPTILMIDAAAWPGPDARGNEAIETVLRSPNWAGVALLAACGDIKPDAERLTLERRLPRRIVVLPESPVDRLAVLRRAMVEARGRALRTGIGNDPGPGGAEKLPMLKSVGVRGELA